MLPALHDFKKEFAQQVIDEHFTKTKVPNALNQFNQWENARLEKLIQLFEAELEEQKSLEPDVSVSLPAELVEQPKSPEVKGSSELKLAVQNAMQRTDIDVCIQHYMFH